MNSCPALLIQAKLHSRQMGLGLAVLVGLALVSVAEVRAQSAEALHVEAAVARRAYYVGQGFEVRVGVVAGQRPKIDVPEIPGALAWKIGMEARPITQTEIGSIAGRESLFLSHFRVVGQRTGTLVIPPIRAQVGDHSGRSQPIRVVIDPIPLAGRTSDFLGGVGQFTLAAEVSPRVVRVGQEVDYRIKVTGPAAWGMKDHPELSRFDRLGLGLRIESGPDETIEEPPVRTFVYRLRVTKVADAVLPPVAIAAFDPASSRYVTKVTPSVPIRAVAVLAFDPESIRGVEPRGSVVRSSGAASILGATVLVGAAVALGWVRRRARSSGAIGAASARRYAMELARRYLSAESCTGRKEGLSARPLSNGDTDALADGAAAQRARDELIQYLAIGLGRPTGALTPDEAWQGVAVLTGSDQLAGDAERLATRCDRILYGDRSGGAPAQDLRASARELFEALGRARESRHRAR
jgi:hypothetical protein